MARTPKFRRGFRFQWEPAQESYVLLYPEGMVKLNGSAGAILNEVNGERSVADIVASLARQFPDVGSLALDVTEFLQDAERQNWIELT